MISKSSFAVLLALTVLMAGGCRGSKVASGVRILSYAELKPDNLTMKRADLALAGTNIRTDIQQAREKNDIQIDLMAYGQIIESERYRSTDTEFGVVDAGGERYEPPIPLIKYPMTVGDIWDWSGMLDTGPEPHKAKATITTSIQDQIIEGGTVHNVVRVEVALAIDSGRPGEPSRRKMTFWIAPNMGVVRREFGDYSTRKPLEQ